MTQKITKRESRTYPIVLPLRYAVPAKLRQLSGTGTSLLIGSRELYFTANVALETGMEIEVSVAWPAGLEDGVKLKLFLSGRILGTKGRWTQVRVDHHDFRTRGRWEESDRPRAAEPYSIGPEAASAPLFRTAPYGTTDTPLAAR